MGRDHEEISHDQVSLLEPERLQQLLVNTAQNAESASQQMHWYAPRLHRSIPPPFNTAVVVKTTTSEHGGAITGQRTIFVHQRMAAIETAHSAQQGLVACDLTDCLPALARALLQMHAPVR